MIPGLTAIALASALAGAPQAARVAVLPTTFVGELDDHWRTQMQDRLLDGLGRGAYEIIEPSALDVPGTDVRRCTSAACHAEVATAAKAQYVIWSAVSVDERNFAVTLQLVDAEGALVAMSPQRCDVCGVGEVARMFGDQAAALASKIDTLVLGRPVLVIDSSPAGAAIRLDGTDIGRTPLERVVTPGRHRAQASKPGFVSQQVQVESVAGVRDELSFDLQRAPEQQRPEDRRRRALRPWGWAALAVGGGSLGVGIGLLAIDERPFQRECSGMDVDAQGDCRLRYNTLAGGIIATVAGVALLAAATGILATTRRRNRRARRP